MAFDERVAARVREVLAKQSGVVEKRMFSGLAFLHHRHMCCGVVGDELMVRVGPAAYEEAVSQPHARQMDFTGRPMVGFVFVGPGGLASDSELETWVTRGLEFASSLPPKSRHKQKGRK
jgi:TfoX/Sxy family transcriptional regulator of competence genes